jgi:DNA-binding response OmpR family regulator
LIIDDNEESVSALKAALESKNEVLTAYNGYDGLKVLEQYQSAIDLVITDLILPDLSGVGLISMLKMKYPGLPIIAMTELKYEIKTSGIKVNADKMLEKTFSIIELEESVSELLTNGGSEPLLNK